ncbi:MAG: helix-turn-helix domain containing protein [Chloroflexi bacterium]|nr:helix-turn-helix domain containing protein [Chloroflexota bacterium]
MPQQTLDERFQNGPPTRSESKRNSWLNAEERRFILWGLKEGWSAARVARALNVNEATVRRFRTQYTEQPELLLRLGLQEMIGTAKEEEYRCLVCGDRFLVRQEVDQHVLSHFLDESTAADVVTEDESGQVQDEKASDEVITSSSNDTKARSPMPTPESPVFQRAEAADSSPGESGLFGSFFTTPSDSNGEDSSKPVKEETEQESSKPDLSRASNSVEEQIEAFRKRLKSQQIPDQVEEPTEEPELASP